jgi:hypothetical protein
MKKYLVLSPFAKDGTKNSGDDLIVQSLISLLNALSPIELEFNVVSIAKSTLNKEETFSKININDYAALLCPGFRISVINQEILNVRLKYIEKTIMNKIPVFLLGSSWCVFPGLEEQTNYKINSKEKALIRYVLNDNKSCITVRDIYTKKLLEKNNIECSLSGDLSLFDINKLKSEPNISNKLETIVISLPHNNNYYKYCDILATKLNKRFGCKVYKCTHQFLPNNKSYKDLSGRAQALSYYNNADYHIGFRYHAHLWFIQNRKPSFLIAEDGRSWGYINTFNDIGMHSSPKYILEKAKKINALNSNLLYDLTRNSRIDTNKILKIVEKEIDNNYKTSKQVFNKIDDLWESTTKNIIEKILEA